jgi:hypothetical protein
MGTLSVVHDVSAPVATVTGAFALGGALLLTAAGAGHLWHRRALPTALRAQRLLPAHLSVPVAIGAVAAEVSIGPSVLATAIGGPSASAVPLVAQAALYATFTAFLWMVLRRRPAAPCGCFGAAERVSRLVVTRAGLLAAATIGALVPGAQFAMLPMTSRLLCLAGGFVVAMAGWLLPVLTNLAGSQPTPTAAARRS